MMALCFAVRHRTPVVEDDGPRVEAQDLDGTAFLPSPREVADLRDRMAIVVQRILVHHLPALKPLEAFVHLTSFLRCHEGGVQGNQPGGSG